MPTPLVPLRDVLNERMTRGQGPSVVPLSSVIAQQVAGAGRQEPSTADRAREAIGYVRTVAGLPSTVRGVAEGVTGDRVARGGQFDQFNDALNTISGGLSLAGLALNPNQSDVRKALGLAGGLTKLASTRTAQAAVPALSVVSKPITLVPATTNAAGQTVAGGLRTTPAGVAGAAIGAGLGAYRISEGDVGHGAADIVTSVMSLANPVFGVMNAAGQVVEYYAGKSGRLAAERKISRLKTVGDTFEDIQRALSTKPFAEAMRQRIGEKGTIGGLLLSLAESNITGQYAERPYYWEPQEDYRRLAGALRALGVQPTEFDRHRVDSVREFLVNAGGREGGPGAIDQLMGAIARGLPADMARFAPALIPRQEFVRRAAESYPRGGTINEALAMERQARADRGEIGPEPRLYAILEEAARARGETPVSTVVPGNAITQTVDPMDWLAQGSA